jgi:hypothetical protein
MICISGWEVEANLNAMRILIEVQNAEGGQVVVTPGQVCRIGRSEPAEWVCAEDSFLSSLHFSVDYSGGQCCVRDLGSRNGTWLNGVKLTEATILRDGDVIAAGQIQFRVRVEAERSGSGLPALVVKELKETQSRIWDTLSKIKQPLFALVDAARSDRAIDLVRRSGERYQSLYEGTQGRKLDKWAPHLVELSQDSPLLLWLLHEGWGKSWGVYLAYDGSFFSLRRHFRRFLMVQGEGGQPFYFRFYDPRVLRLFLARCSDETAQQFFESVDEFFLEGDDPTILLRLNRNNRKAFSPAGASSAAPSYTV